MYDNKPKTVRSRASDNGGGYLKPYFVLLFMAFFYDTVLHYIYWKIYYMPYIQLIAPLLIPGTVVVMLILSRREGGIFDRFQFLDYLFIVFVISALYISRMVYPETYDVVTERYIPRVFEDCIPFFAVGLFIRADDKTMDFLGKSAKFSLLLGFVYLYYMVNFGNSEAIGNDNMGLAYNYLIVEGFVIIHAFRKRKLFDIILAVAGGIMLISLGTRGPIILMLVFVGCCVLKELLYGQKRKLLLFAAVVLAVIIVSVYFESIVRWLIDVISDFGLSTRVLDKLLDSELLVSDARTDIRQIVISKILERPVMGYGVAGEWQFVGWNAHNMYLTFLSNYGIILGGGMIAALVVLFIMSFRKNPNSNAQYLLLFFGCNVFAKGFFSGDPLTMEVFFLIGFALNQIRLKRERKAYDNTWNRGGFV